MSTYLWLEVAETEELAVYHNIRRYYNFALKRRDWGSHSPLDIDIDILTGLEPESCPSYKAAIFVERKI
jgi:hypothetical protein